MPGHTFPPRLKKGAHIRVIAPARSLQLIGKESAAHAKKKLEALGYRISYAEHAWEVDIHSSGPVQARLDDLHAAFSDEDVDAILTCIGGYNSNQLLGRIDYELIKANPKILCGYSDITALQNAIHAKTGLVTYHGPHFSTFGMDEGNEYTITHFQHILGSHGPTVYEPSKNWSSDEWWLDQENRTWKENPGLEKLHGGTAEGTIIGGNLATFPLLCGTEFMPSLKDSILLIEDDTEYGRTNAENFDRQLQQLLQQPSFQGVKGIIIGRCQPGSNLDKQAIIDIIERKPELAELPILYGMDFGHTMPMTTIPIGGYAKMNADTKRIEITRH